MTENEDHLITYDIPYDHLDFNKLIDTAKAEVNAAGTFKSPTLSAVKTSDQKTPVEELTKTAWGIKTSVEMNKAGEVTSMMLTAMGMLASISTTPNITFSVN